MQEKIQYKKFPFSVTETKEIEIDGQKFGIVEGFASTYGNVDRVGDRVMQGAFADTIAEYKNKNRKIRMMYQHMRGELIGGFPVEHVKDLSEGLYVRGEINLEVQRGREAYALAKQRVLTDMSIGYSVLKSSSVHDENTDEDILNLEKLTLWEISLVDEPSNAEAVITAVKSITTFQDLPFADRETAWDSAAAIKKLREWAGAEDAPNAKYKQAFLYFDEDSQQLFGSYKLPIADVIDGTLKVIPRAIFAAAAALQGARGGVDISDEDKQKAKNHLSKYYKKLDMPAPWDKAFFDYTIKSLRDVEGFLKEYGISQNASKAVISKVKEIAKIESLSDGREEQQKELHRDDATDYETIFSALKTETSKLLKTIQEGV